MTPSPRLPLPPAAAARGQLARVSAGPARARRGRALLQLAERHGEVSVIVRGPRGAVAHAADVLELLDELNTDARLRWGGVRKWAGMSEIVYLSSAGHVG